MAFSLNISNAFFTDTVPITGYPFSFVGWFRVPDVASLTPLTGLVSTSTGARCDLYYGGNGGKEAVAVTSSGGTGSAYSTSPMTPGAWHHLAAVFEADDLRSVYLDGANKGTNSTNLPLGTLNFLYLGNISGSEAVEIAGLAVVASALDERQIAALAKGCPILASACSPSLVTYQDCIRYPNRPGLGLELTTVGTPTVVDHPRELFPTGMSYSSMSNRFLGPLSVEESLYRAFSSDQGQVAFSGVIPSNSILPGEVVS